MKKLIRPDLEGGATVGGVEVIDEDGNIVANIKDTLASGKIYVGSAANVTSEVTPSGDLTMNNAGVFTIGAKKVGASKMALSEGSIFRGAAGGAAEELAKGTANQVLTMDGGGGFPGWSTPATVVYSSLNVFLTSADVKALATSPFELLPAPGAGQAYQFLTASFELRYGTNVFTVGGADDLAIRYTDGAGVVVSEAIETTGFLDQAANTVTFANAADDVIVTSAGCENQSLVLDCTGVDPAGNAGNDNELRVRIVYRMIQI